MWAERDYYGASLLDAAPLELVARDGRRVELEVHRWLDDADAADHSVLDRCVQPVLDVGCGPGRMVRACYDRNLAALGVDIAPEAVALSNSRGGPALRCDVFDELPDEGEWSTILLLDGNVGIGGDVTRLLTRVVGLLAVGGQLVIEPSADRVPERRMHVRFARQGVVTGRRFRWSVIGAPALIAAAERAGLCVREQWHLGTRTFVCFTRAGLSG